MAARKALDRERGVTPEIRADGDDVTFRFEVAGVPEQMKLVLRCDSDDGLWASIVTASAIDADLYPGNSETN